MVLAAVGQICSTASMTHNLAQCQKLVTKAVAAGAKALFLPEASDYIASNPIQSLSLCWPITISPFVLGLQSLARQHSLAINVGIHEPSTQPSARLRNTLIWISTTGTITHRYSKLHLFDIDLFSTGGPRMRESETTEAGSTIEIPYDSTELGLKIGSLICFDLRFPEPSLRLRRLGADVLLYPSAFTVPTGKLHWEALLRARAIENQCWIVASAQCGRHNEKRVSWGEAMVVGPDGRVVGSLGRVEDAQAEREGSRDVEMMVVDLNAESVQDVRQSIPVEKLRRTDVYSVV